LRTGPAIDAPLVTGSHAAGRQVATHWDCSVGSRCLISKWAHHTKAGWTYEAAKNSENFSRAFSGHPCRKARPIDQFGASGRGARASRHTSRVVKRQILDCQPWCQPRARRDAAPLAVANDGPRRCGGTARGASWAGWEPPVVDRAAPRCEFDVFLRADLHWQDPLSS